MTDQRVIGPLVEAEFVVQLDGYEPGFDDAPALDVLRENLTGRRLRKPADRDAARRLSWWLIDLTNHWDSLLESRAAETFLEGLTRAEARRIREQLGDLARWVDSV